MTGDVYAVLREAALGRVPVTCIYRGRRREICPHALGAKDGRRRVLAFQHGGESGSGLPPEGEWRCLEVEEITEAALRPGPWRTQARGFRPQHCLDTIEVEVVY